MRLQHGSRLLKNAQVVGATFILHNFPVVRFFLQFKRTRSGVAVGDKIVLVKNRANGPLLVSLLG